MEGDIIVTIIGGILGSGILNGIITHFLYSNRLKKELRAKNNNMIAEKIAESLSFFRDMELMLKTIEIYDAKREFQEKGAKAGFIEWNCAYYPSVFNNWESFSEFYDRIRECRAQYEKYLSCKLALNLVFIDRYIMKMSLFMSGYEKEELLPTFGAFFLYDLQKWQTKIDKMIVNEMNKCSSRIESHETKKWSRLRKRELVGQWNETFLHYMIEEECDKKIEKKMQFMKESLENVLSMCE